MKVLIIKTTSMGDILHTLPALTDAVNALPNISFDWVVEENFSEIPTWHPAVHKIISVAIRRWRKNWFSTNNRHERYNFKYNLQCKNYDITIDAQGLLKSAIFITRNIHHNKHGLDFRSIREPLASLFYNHKHAINKKQHAIERIRQLFSMSLGYHLPKSPSNYAIAKNFKQLSCTKPYLIFLHATTKYNKHWPIKYWKKLLKLVNNAGYNVKLPWWKQHEYQQAMLITEGQIYAEILPKLSLTQIAQQLMNATAIVSVDTGLSHLAAALNKPNLTLYGPTDPKLIGVCGQNQKFLRAQNYNMNNLSTQHVWNLLQTFIY